MLKKTKYVSIPDPTLEAKSQQTCILALKENVEYLTGQRGAPPVTWDDLVRLGVVKQGDVPR